MIDLAAVDLGELADALAQQDDWDHRWLIDPRTGELAFWTSDTGIDGQDPVDVDELDLVPIDPLPPHVWWQDMADFAAGISDEAAARRLTQSLEGKGAFRKFRNAVHDRHPDLITPWNVLRDVRRRRRAVEWLLDQGLIEESAAQQFARDNPDPALP